MKGLSKTLMRYLECGNLSYSEIFACHLTSLSLLKTKYMGLNNSESLNGLINAFLVKFIT